MISQKLNESQKGIVAIIIFIILVILIFTYERYSSKSLLKHSIITHGVVTEVGFASKIGGYTHYTFLVNGKLYKGSQGLPNLKNIEDRSIIVNRTFPVVVDTTNYSNSKMLLDSLSFVQLGLNYPDSQRWFREYLK